MKFEAVYSVIGKGKLTIIADNEREALKAFAGIPIGTLQAKANFDYGCVLLKKLSPEYGAGAYLQTNPLPPSFGDYRN